MAAKGGSHPLSRLAGVTHSLARKSLSVLKAATRKPPFAYPSGYDLYYRYSHDIGNVLGLRLIGLYARDGRVRWRAYPALISLALILSPFGLAVFLESYTPSPAGQRLAYYGWLLYFVSLCLVVSGLSWAGVSVFHGLTPALGEVLTDKGKRAYDLWADRATATGPQVLFGLIVSAGAVAALRLASQVPGMDHVVFISPASYLSIAVSGFFISCGGYWILAGSILAVFLTQEGAMDLNWYAPIVTPGVELLARCYRLAFYGASVGVGLCLYPILSWAYAVPTTTLLSLVKGGLFVASLSAIMAIALVPQWRLTRTIAEARRAAFTELSSLLPRRPAEVTEDVDERQAFLLTWLQTLAGTRNSTVSESAVVGVLLGAATAMLPYFVKLLAGTN